MPYKNKAIKQIRQKRWRDKNKARWGEIDPRSVFLGKKLCRRCKQEKGPFEFNKDPSTKDGIHVWCKLCHVQNRRLKRYGMELPEGWECEICGEPATVVDHDHKSGYPRGFLCGSCNLGLGHFKDSEWRIERALTYLRSCVKIVEVG